MLKKTLGLSALLAILMVPVAHAQTTMSMDEQIARIQQAEMEIEEYNSAQEAKRAEAERRAADIKKRAQQAAEKSVQLKKKRVLNVKQNLIAMLTKARN